MHHRRGFTEIEVMIVLTIIAIIAAIAIPKFMEEKKTPRPGQTWLFQGRPAVVLYEIRQADSHTGAYRVRFVGETGEATALRAELVPVAEESQ